MAIAGPRDNRSVPRGTSSLFTFSPKTSSSSVRKQSSPLARKTSKTSNLLNCPPEILEMIAEKAATKDLLNLRLVSREICEMSKRTFCEAHINRRCSILSNEESLRALLNIVENENLALGMKQINFTVEEIRNPRVPEGEQDRRLGRLPRHPAQEQRKLEGWRLEREWEACYKTQEEDRKKGVCLNLLTVIFSRLRRLGHVVEVRLVDTHEACKLPFAIRKMTYLPDAQLIWEANYTTAAPLVLEAIALSAYPVKSFVTSFQNRGCSLSALSANAQRLSSTSEAFRSMKKLHLKFCVHDNGSSTNFSDRLEVLESAIQVDDFSLHADTSHPPWSKRKAREQNQSALNSVLCLNLPSLKRLDLQGFDLSLEQLGEIVERHPRLEKLHFHALGLHSPYPKDSPHSYQMPTGMDVPVDGDGYVSLADLGDIEAVEGIMCKRIGPCTVFELVKGKSAWNRVV